MYLWHLIIHIYWKYFLWTLEAVADSLQVVMTCISFYLCITNYQKFSSIKQHIYYIIVSANRELRCNMTWFLVRLPLRCLPTLDSYLRLSYIVWEQTDSKFIWLLIEFSFLWIEIVYLLAISQRPPSALCHLTLWIGQLTTWHLVSLKPTEKSISQQDRCCSLCYILTLNHIHPVTFVILLCW